MYNVAGRLIRKLYLSNSVYHAVVQDLNGRLYHMVFTDRQEALDYLDSFSEPIIWEGEV